MNELLPRPTSVILIQCSDEKGLMHRVSGALLNRGANILENNEHVDRLDGVFHMRTEFSGSFHPSGLLEELSILLPSDARISLRTQAPRQIVVFATRESHCLGDLLLRQLSGELDARILAVVSQYSELRDLVARFGVPFHYIPIEKLNRPEHEARILECLSAYRFDYLVLAKYMRILTPGFVERFENRIINIHHSFLPAFMGRNPYQQAYERGVKIIGATAHFVNGELDEGPIIAQSVIPTHHSQDARAMAHAGRDIEKTVLARALELVIEDRVLVRGKRTIVFE